MKRNIFILLLSGITCLLSVSLIAGVVGSNNLSAKSVKVYKIKMITPSGESKFYCKDDEYILIAAERAGLDLPYSSRAGAEPSSAAKLIRGKVDNSAQSFLDDDQIRKGYILLDTAIPLEDCEIHSHKESEL